MLVVFCLSSYVRTFNFSDEVREDKEMESVKIHREMEPDERVHVTMINNQSSFSCILHYCINV